MMMRQARRSSAIQHDTVRCGFLSRCSYVAPSRRGRNSAKRPQKELTYCPIYGFKPCVIGTKDLTPALFCCPAFRRVPVRSARIRGNSGVRIGVYWLSPRPVPPKVAAVVSLTEVAIRKARPDDKPRKLADERGLYLLINPSGSRLWRLKYRFDGKEKLLSLGAYPEVPLADARERREVARKQLASGSDPSVHRRPIVRGWAFSFAPPRSAAPVPIPDGGFFSGNSPRTVFSANGTFRHASPATCAARESQPPPEGAMRTNDGHRILLEVIRLDADDAPTTTTPPIGRGP